MSINHNMSSYIVNIDKKIFIIIINANVKYTLCKCTVGCTCLYGVL